MKLPKIKITCPIDHGYTDGRDYLVVAKIGQHLIKMNRYATRAEQQAAAKAARP